MELVRLLHRRGSVLLETVEPPDERRVALLFCDPSDVRVATTPVELIDLLEDVQSAADAGGYAAGFLSYEAGFLLEPRAGPPHPTDHPFAWFAFYDAPRRLPIKACLRSMESEQWGVDDGTHDWTPETYREAFDRVRSHIYEGDVYQINLTGRMRFGFHGSPEGLYASLCRTQSSAFGAFINEGERQILCRSPELFFARSHDRIVARPMKGTAEVGVSMAETRAIARALAADGKNQAENLMIVDLLRNDLSVLCEPGSVHVPELFAVEFHETLVQMTSTVRGRLRGGVRLSNIMAALFPCGSVTGAPKIRSMQVIRSVERSPRGPYCGAIGYVGPGKAVFNVAIRTLEIEDGRGRLGTGSGVVWDSRVEEEFSEAMLKARFFTGLRSTSIQQRCVEPTYS